MAAEAEAQLWKLKESLDWKTIAVQQMVAALSNCQVRLCSRDSASCVIARLNSKHEQSY
jgi:hypothetical protein